ncbi:ATP-binding protein [Marinibaculum pumilum]|uniref:histidine kinase n=1 Tax=Marinibaculum pumilum TaxID=1766165 RepID=A0ABV7L8P7_9PROT
MSAADPLSERVLILAPQGRDAQIAAMILHEAGFSADIRSTLAELSQELEKGAGLAIVTDEAVRHADLRPLAAFLAGQPSWSDLPVVLLTHRGGGLERNPAAARLAEVLGNVTFLERPFHPTTLASVVRTALRGRRRQYQARSQLEALQEGEQRLQTALWAGHLGSWMLDLKGGAFWTSETCRAHFGRAPEEELDFAAFRGAAHPQDRARLRAAFAASQRSGSDLAIEYRILWPDGSTHWVDLRARAVRSADQRVAQFVGVSSDISFRKRAELERERLLEALAAERAALSDLTATLEERVRQRSGELMAEVAAKEKAQEQLVQAQKMESIGQLTGGVAHDFNNLLTAVISNLELLGKRLPDDARAQRLIDGAMQGARRGAALTQRMLAFARQQDLRTTSADLAELLEGMRDMLKRTLGPQVALQIDVAEGLPPARVDANQVELAILNLAINARDAMPERGRIAIAVDRRAHEPGKGLPDRDYLCVTVTDDGAGMDAATLARAVEPFFSTKPTGKGTGLGLSMVHGLAVQLGGLLELSSEVGRGTTATLWLPVATEPVVLPAAPAPAPASRQAVARILVVDDDPLIAMSTVDMLEDLGHQVIEAESATRALEILEAGAQVDMIMTDHAMPGMTGMELAEVVHRSHPLLPILLATGYADALTDAEADLPRLSKPYQQSELAAEIDRLLNPPAQAER